MSFRRNAASNFAAGALPALVTLITLPLIVRGLGTEVYGLFTLITSIVGYFALVDVNVTAGSTKHIAHHHALGEHDEVSRVLSFGLLTYLGIGLIGALPILLLSDWLPTHAFKVPASLQPLAGSCLQVAALGFFLGQLQSYLQSIPQALLRYDVSAKLEVAFGLLVPLSTLALVLAGHGLLAVICARVALSAVNCLLLALSIRRLLPGLRLGLPNRATSAKVASFSAYSFLSRAAFLTYSHADKLIIGAVIGMRPLAYYTVAATLGNRVLGLMYRISAVMFPAASALAAKADEDRLRALYLKLCRYVSFANASVLLLLAGFAQPLLTHWMGPEFAREGALILQLVACAQFIDSLTNIPSLVNDGLGHPKVSGLFAITRAGLGLALLYGLVCLFGVVGAASAHLIAALVMTAAFLAYVHGRTVPCQLARLWREAYRPSLLTLVVGTALAYGGVRWAGTSLFGLSCVLLGLTAALGGVALQWILQPHDKGQLLGLLGLRSRRQAQ